VGTGGYGGGTGPQAVNDKYYTQNPLQSQLTDIYGSGVGGALTNELEGMGGMDSSEMQEYYNSLQPYMAQASATTNSTLAGQGVGANSSVNAIAQANLGAQETATLSGESAQIAQTNQQETIQLLESTMGAAEQQTADSAAAGWNLFSAFEPQVASMVGQSGSSITPAQAQGGTASSQSSSGGVGSSALTNSIPVSAGSSGIGDAGDAGDLTNAESFGYGG
jgi:hypothetical protein